MRFYIKHDVNLIVVSTACYIYICTCVRTYIRILHVCVHMYMYAHVLTEDEVVVAKIKGEAGR